MLEGSPLGGVLESLSKAWFTKENQQCVVVHAFNPSTWDEKFKVKQAGLHGVLSQSDKTEQNKWKWKIKKKKPN